MKNISREIDFRVFVHVRGRVRKRVGWMVGSLVMHPWDRVMERVWERVVERVWVGARGE